MRKSLLTALGLGLWCLNALAGPELIGIDIASLHAHPGMNGVNPGLYARWSNGWGVGSYYNSERRMSLWSGYTLHDREDRFAITLGAVTGYRRKVTPMVIPSVRIGLDEKTSVRLSLACEPRNPALHLSIERRF